MSFKRCVILFLLLTVLAATPALATPIIYTNRAAFDTAVGSYTLLTLDAPDSFSYVNTSYINDGVCIPGVCSYGGQLLLASVPDYNCGCGIYGTINTSNMTTIAAGRPVTAFGFDVFVGGPPDSPTFMDIAVYGATPFSLSVQADDLSFFGITDSSPFGIDLSSHTFPFGIDNVAMKLVAVPEPATIILLPAGLAILAAWRARQRKRGTA